MADTRWQTALRVAFLLAVAVFAWHGLRGRTDEIGAALRDTSGPGIAAAFLLVLVGLLATGFVWLRLMAVVGAPVPWREGLAVFFVGQLGKYVPGSVWSIGAQAQMAGRWSVPRRATVSAGLLFLGYHVATGVAGATLVDLVGGVAVPWPAWVTAALLLASALGLLPIVVRQVGSRVAGHRLALDLRESSAILCAMAGAWAAYAVALVLLTPDRPWRDVFALGTAFALSYAVGVVVVVAPAGVGARETFFVLLLTPLLGVGGATALALLARVTHTAADVAMAGGWWLVSRVRGQQRERPVVAPR